MSQVLVSRKKLTLPEGITSIDTGLTQDALGVTPPLDGENATALLPGVASRVMVQPLAPLVPWSTGNIRHGEPYWEPSTYTVWVDFWVEAGAGEQDVTVLFWNPHTISGAVDADPYTEYACTAPDLRPEGNISSPTQGGSNNGSAGSSFTVTNPGDATGQLILATFALNAIGTFADPASDPVLSDAGWTVLSTHSLDLGGGDGLKSVIAYRISDADTDPATWGFTSGVAGWLGAALVQAYVDYTGSPPVVVGNYYDDATANVSMSLTLPSVTGTQNGLLLAFGVGSNEYTITWTTTSPDLTEQGAVNAGTGPRTAGVAMTLFQERLTVDGATGTRNLTNNDSFNLSTRAGYGALILLPSACGIFPDGSSPIT